MCRSKVRDERDGQPTVVALPVPRPYGDFGKIVNWAIEESFPDAVGAFVDWLVKRAAGRWKTGESATLVPIRPGTSASCSAASSPGRGRHAALRSRARSAAHPHVLVGGRSFHDREEIIAVRNALCAIEWPDDELRVFATLRGPFFAFATMLCSRSGTRTAGSIRFAGLLLPGASRCERTNARLPMRSLAGEAPSRAQPPAHRTDHHQAARSRARPCRNRHLADGRASARERLAHRGARPRFRTARRVVVPGIRRAARGGGRTRKVGRGADRRRGDGGRADHDRPPGERPRVSRRHPCRPDLCAHREKPESPRGLNETPLGGATLPLSST